LNRNMASLDDVRVRKAINYAYNREEIVEALFPGSEARYQYSRSGLSGYDASLEGAYSYEPDRARALLAEAGHPDGIDLGQVIVVNSVTPGVADVLQEQFAEVGIRMTPIVKDGLEGPQSFSRGDASAMLQVSTMGTGFTAGSDYRWGP